MAEGPQGFREIGNQDFLSYHWYIEFCKVDENDKPIPAQTWVWRGDAIGVTLAINQALDAMIDAKSPDTLFWRISKVVNLDFQLS